MLSMDLMLFIYIACLFSHIRLYLLLIALQKKFSNTKMTITLIMMTAITTFVERRCVCHFINKRSDYCLLSFTKCNFVVIYYSTTCLFEI